MAMSFPVALFVAFTGSVLVIAAASLRFTAVFTAGYRQRALRLVMQELDARAPNRSGVKLESRVHARWDALTELAQRVELDRDSVEGRDRALAVLVDKVGDGAFLDSIEQERREHQEAQLRALGRRLSGESDLPDLIERAESWIKARERRLLWLSFRKVGPMLFRSLDPRLNAAFSRGTVVAFLVTLIATGLVAAATHLNLMSMIATAVAMLTAAVSLIWVVLPLAVRATGAYLGDADPRMVRLLIASIVATGAITVVAGTMVMTGTYERAMTRADELATGALDDVTLSPGAALAIGLFVINGLVLVPALVGFHVMRNARVVTWERVRACGQLVGLSCMLPITIGLAPAVAGSELTERFPGWIRAWIITCWGIAGLIYLASAVLRRRPLTP